MTERRDYFTARLYNHLTRYCSFIDHFNREGFYAIYFGTPNEHLMRFLDQFDPNKPGVSAE